MMRPTLLLTMVALTVASLVFGLGPATVNLRTAGNYVILSSTGVTTTGTTSIVGDIGLSPAAATYMTGFGLMMDPSGTYSTSVLVTGRIYAANYTTPTPVNLTTAIGNMQTAYTDAASRVNPDYTELYTGVLTGQTLIPGLYKWSSGVTVGAGGCTLTGGPNDVWIFQIAQNLTVANAAIITLNGGAQPQNIFWQVAGQTTIGTTAQFKGVVLCQTLISMNTGATINGRLLAQTAVTLNQNSVVKPSGATGVCDDVVTGIGNITYLETNYPNPFNPNTTIRLNISKGEQGTLTIYNIRGQTVLTKGFESGKHHFGWITEGLPSGIYMYRLQTNTTDIRKKMILQK